MIKLKHIVVELERNDFRDLEGFAGLNLGSTCKWGSCLACLDL